MKIALFSLEKIPNIGDKLLCATTEYLVHKVDDKIECIHCELLPQFTTIPFEYRFEHFLGNVVKYFFIRLGKKGDRQYRDIAYRIQYYRYFRKVVKSVDRIIYPVGMLNYSVQHFSYVYYLINQLAEKFNKPVMMSAMSIEKPDDNDWRFFQIKKAVNFKSVKLITTRDGINGLKRLNEHYVERDILTKIVGDPALWSLDKYLIRKKTNSNIIGINLIRSNIFNDYKEGRVTPSDLTNFYINLISEIVNRGYDYELFCNGMDDDYEFGIKILNELNLPKQKLLPKFTKAEELLETISRYKAVFGARLHACIISVSLGVPVAGMLWDNKLEFFSESMGIRSFFSSSSELKAKVVADKLESSIKHPFDYTNLDYYKNETLKSIQYFILNDW